jgi:Protein of unknown function (DUF3892)
MPHPFTTVIHIGSGVAEGLGNMIYITAVHMSAGGAGNEHIAGVRWSNAESGAVGESTTPAVIHWIDNDGGVAKVKASPADVLVGTVDANPKYLRTYADGKWTNNLLSLPRF